jgi:hypothetical protein
VALAIVAPLLAAEAQLTPYEIGGSIAADGASWHNIEDVRKDDLVLISISSVEGCDSSIFFPNQTLCQNIGYSKMHIYQFKAEESGTYLLRMSSAFGTGTSYSGTSSHKVNNASLMTPFSVNGTIAANGAVWHNIYNVNRNELMLISITGPVGFDSSLFYPNQTQLEHIPYSKMHIYQLNATQSGTYLLQMSSAFGSAVIYSGISSHSFDIDVISTPSPTPLPSLTPSPTVTPAASPSTSASSASTPLPTASSTTPPTFTATPFTISAVASGSVTFEVPTTYQNSGANFTYDFGDGTNITTPNTSVTHMYQEPGNYTFTLKLEGAPEQRAIESYSVIVTGPSENSILKYMWPIVTSVTAGLTVAAITALLRRRKKKTQAPNLPPPPP